MGAGQVPAAQELLAPARSFWNLNVCVCRGRTLARCESTPTNVRESREHPGSQACLCMYVLLLITSGMHPHTAECASAGDADMYVLHTGRLAMSSLLRVFIRIESGPENSLFLVIQSK
jgi:hypothetical protein